MGCIVGGGGASYGDSGAGAYSRRGELIGVVVGDFKHLRPKPVTGVSVEAENELTANFTVENGHTGLTIDADTTSKATIEFRKFETFLRAGPTWVSPRVRLISIGTIRDILDVMLVVSSI